FRAEAWEKAARYLRQAGHKAWDRSATRETVNVLEHALNALAHLPETREILEQAIDLRLILCALLDVLVEPNQALESARQAYTLAEKLDDPLFVHEPLAFLGYGSLHLGEPAAAIEQGEAALAAATDRADVPVDPSANYWLGLAYIQQGSYRKATQLLLR